MQVLRRVSNFTVFSPLRYRQCVAGVMGGTTSRGLQHAAAGDFVHNTVNTNCVVVFSKTTCGYCRMAKKVFEDLGTPFAAVELNHREDGTEIQKALQEITGGNTVPRVFVNGQCIGGGTETKQLHERGQLLPLLAQCAPQSSEGSAS